MSPREQRERVQAAIQADEREPLAETQARLETALRGKGLRLVLLGLLTLGGLGTASQTGALGLVLPSKHEDAALMKEIQGQGRLIEWLVDQEADRQVRECVAAGKSDCRIRRPPKRGDVE